eukprot:2619664-Rhodomonas_salina.1
MAPQPSLRFPAEAWEVPGPVVLASPSRAPRGDGEGLVGREAGGSSPLSRKSNTPRVLELTPHRRPSSAGDADARPRPTRLPWERERRAAGEQQAAAGVPGQGARTDAPLATYYPELESGFGRVSAGALDDERLQFALKDRSPLGAAGLFPARLAMAPVLDVMLAAVLLVEAMLTVMVSGGTEALARVGLDLLRQPGAISACSVHVARVRWHGAGDVLRLLETCGCNSVEVD